MAYADLTSLRARLNQAPQTTANDALYEECLESATGIVRGALRSLLADPAFDYVVYGAASTKLVRGYNGYYLSLPAHQQGSITLVEYQSGTNPATYTSITSTEWEEQANGQLYRAGGWGGSYYDYPRYRVTAVWGYGLPPAEIKELTLELAVNIWRSRDKGGFTEMIGVEGSGAVRMVAGLNAQQQMILTNLRDQLWMVSV